MWSSSVVCIWHHWNSQVVFNGIYQLAYVYVCTCILSSSATSPIPGSATLAIVAVCCVGCKDCLYCTTNTICTAHPVTPIKIQSLMDPGCYLRVCRIVRLLQSEPYEWHMPSDSNI